MIQSVATKVGSPLNLKLAMLSRPGPLMVLSGRNVGAATQPPRIAAFNLMWD